uniref:Reverse transcriptase domain-containing protein n=1 Tax=Nothobranchius furzeri TaxID=105023 RepID=A0A8C6MJ04_NOTFU
MHVDIENDSLNVAFSNILDSIGFTQRIHSSTHSCHHTLDLVLTCGIECEEITIFPHNPVLLDNFLINVEFFVTEFSRHESKFHYSRSLSDNAFASFKSTVPSLLSSASQRNVAEGNIFISSPSQIDAFVHNVTSYLCVALDDVAPLKKKVIRDRKSAPWFNCHLRALKQNSRKLERTGRSTHHEEAYLSWKNRLVLYKNKLRQTRTAYFSALIEENKNNPKFLFSTVAKLTQNHSSEPFIPLALSSNDFMGIFTSKINSIRNKLFSILPNAISSSSVSEAASEVTVEPHLCLNRFDPVELSELSKILASSKPSTCILDPIPTKLFKDAFPLVTAPIPDIINLSLVNGYVPQDFKVAVIKPSLKKPSLDPDDPMNYRPISNLPFLSKVLEKIVAIQVCEHLNTNDLFEEFQSGFREYHSTETALVRVTNYILMASGKNLVSVLVLLDLSAAFDTVDYDVLVEKLEHVVEIKGTALGWFKSYLSDRFHFVNEHDKSSSYSRVTCRAPQGSVLGPIFFTIYMLPIVKIIRQHRINFHCYADDTQLYLSINPDEPNRLGRLQIMS